MSEDLLHPTPTSVPELAEELLEKARASSSKRAGQGVYAVGGGSLRQVLTALAHGASLAAHDAPPEATLQVIKGRVMLTSDAEDWELGQGQLIAIPQAKHGVVALEDAVFLLTVSHARSTD